MPLTLGCAFVPRTLEGLALSHRSAALSRWQHIPALMVDVAQFRPNVRSSTPRTVVTPSEPNLTGASHVYPHTGNLEQYAVARQVRSLRWINSRQQQALRLRFTV